MNENQPIQGQSIQSSSSQNVVNQITQQPVQQSVKQNVQQFVESQQVVQNIQQPVQIVQQSNNVQQVQQPVQSQQISQNQTQNVQINQQQTQKLENGTSVSMMIQELLVKQQQYQQQYNQLAAYIQNTPNLPIEDVNKIKLQLDQLNSLFIQGKQKLQQLGYNQVQVNKPAEVKKGGKNNFSFKKLAIGCGLLIILILLGFIVTIAVLINNPSALTAVGITTSSAKMFLQLFSGLFFGGAIIIMLGVIIGNIYRLITVKGQSKGKNILGLIGGFFGMLVFGASLGVMFVFIGKIQEEIVSYDVIQPVINGKAYKGKDSSNQGEYYNLIAPISVEFRERGNEVNNINQNITDITLICGNKQGQELSLSGNYDNQETLQFKSSCLYAEKGSYYYKYKITYQNPGEQISTAIITGGLIDIKSEIMLYDSSNKRIYPNSGEGEFNLGEAPAKISVDTNHVFRDYELSSYHLKADLNSDSITDREDQTSFDYAYNIPQVYTPTIEFSDIPNSLASSFNVRVEQSDKPICDLVIKNYSGTSKYNIQTQFIDDSSYAIISSYNYSIINTTTNKTIDTISDSSKEITYTFPEKGSYKVRQEFVTNDGKSSRCESNIIQLKKETFNVQYSLLQLDSTTSKYKELCSSDGSNYSSCTDVSLDSLPQKFQLVIKSITPSSNNLDKSVYLDDKALLGESDSYSFEILEEGTFTLKIVTADSTLGIDKEEKDIIITVKKPDIVGKLTITDPDTKNQVSEGFEPMTVILDASKTEINIPGDKIVYFTWDFGDGEIKENQQNGVVAHTYNFDYVKETGIFAPKVTITTLLGRTETIVSPTVLNVKKGLVDISLSSTSHPSSLAKIGNDVTFQAEFDGLPESMTRDFGDGTPTETCQGRTCTEQKHVFKSAGIFSVKLTLDFDALQKVESTMEFKVVENNED